MTKGKKIFSIISSLFLVGALIAGTTLVFQNQNIVKKAAPATTLTITPSSQNKSPGSSVPVTVLMDTGVNQVIGFDLSINFDPNVFEVSGISPGTADATGFTVIRNQVDNTTGNILYSIFNLDPTKALSGSGLTILNITARIKPGAALGIYHFTFDPSSAVAALSEKQNVLMNTYPGEIVVANAATLTPTPAGVPNYCGGTCGSNNNCQANYMCYHGFCRNPNCPSDSTCGCAAPTVTPTPPQVPSRTSSPVTTVKKYTPTPTPEIVYYKGGGGFPLLSSPAPTNATNTPSSTLIPLGDQGGRKTGLDNKYIAIIAAGLIVLTVAVTVLFKSVG